ncbi:hypothetical protein ACIGNX_13100 [Actinosynnema sp. NPDC053489]|uniref:hypothetical protein n=1 Tax=Actinosynnema sp. NPDC053489 TaxID=3363916 RepID=UPI0037C7484F
MPLRDATPDDPAALLVEITGSSARVVTEPARLRPARSEVTRLLSDNTKARALTGWTPTVGLRDGLTRTSDWIREHRREGLSYQV